MVRDGVQEMTTLFHVTAVLHSSSLATLNANLTRLPQTQQVHRAKLGRVLNWGFRGGAISG
jgi:hypothetical protein